MENSLLRTNQIFAGLDLNMAIDRGMQFAGHSNDSKDILNVLTQLPEGLKVALRMKKGFLALARPQI